MTDKRLQIDVLGESKQNKELITCRLTVDGRDCHFMITKYDYNALIQDNIFIRDGKNQDSAGVWNTTNVFVEKV